MSALAASAGARPETALISDLARDWQARKAEAPAASRVVVIDDPAELMARAAELSDLAADAVEPNPFYEPWMLCPAFAAYGPGCRARIVLVYSDAGPDGEKVSGLFPIEPRCGYHNLPIGGYTLWKYVHCYLCTPLVRRGFEVEALTALLDWAAASSGLIELARVAGDGPFHRALEAAVSRRGLWRTTTGDFTRATFHKAASVEAYFSATLSNKGRRELKRRERALGDIGAVVYLSSAERTDAEPWISEFLALEASGWKGRAGTALACKQRDRDYFASVIREAADERRLMMVSLRLDGQPIAIQCNFFAAEGCFAFKTAYDEEYRRFSPGVLLQAYTIALLHRWTGIDWVDTCSDPNSEMANRLGSNRRRICTELVALGGLWPSMVVLLLPALKKVKHWIAGARRGWRRLAAESKRTAQALRARWMQWV